MLDTVRRTVFGVKASVDEEWSCMDGFLKNWLENALIYYAKVVFLYQPSEALCIELRTILHKEKRKILLLTDMETMDFPCSQRRLAASECRWLLQLYLSYNFADNFIFLTDQKKLPWPSIANFIDTGLAARREILEAMLK